MVQEHIFEARLSDGSLIINCVLRILQFEEDKNTLMYAPELEIYGVGKTLREAKKSFNIGLEEFFTYTIHKGTFEKEMGRLGCKMKGRKKKMTFRQPPIADLLQSDKRLTNILQYNENARMFNEPIQMAVPAWRG